MHGYQGPRGQWMDIVHVQKPPLRKGSASQFDENLVRFEWINEEMVYLNISSC
jgi:hypothetical protein